MTVVLISGGFGQSSVIFGVCQRHETLPTEQETRFTALLLLQRGEKTPFQDSNFFLCSWSKNSRCSARFMAACEKSKSQKFIFLFLFLRLDRVFKERLKLELSFSKQWSKNNNRNKNNSTCLANYFSSIISIAGKLGGYFELISWAF